MLFWKHLLLNLLQYYFWILVQLSSLPWVYYKTPCTLTVQVQRGWVGFALFPLQLFGSIGDDASLGQDFCLFVCLSDKLYLQDNINHLDFPAPKFVAGILNILVFFFLNSVFKAGNAGSDTAGHFAAFSCFAFRKAETQATPKTPGSGHHLFPSNIWNINRLERGWSCVGWTNLRQEPPPPRKKGKAAANVRSSRHTRRCVTPVSCLHFSIDLWGSSFPDPPPSGGGTSTWCE